MNFFKKIFFGVGAKFKEFSDRIKTRRAERADLVLAHQIVTKRRLPSLSQWRHLPKVMTAGEKKTLILSLSAILVGLLLIGGGWAIRHAVIVPAAGGEYREGIVGRPHAVNPILSSGNDVDEDIIRLVYSGLYKRDASGRLVPDLAETTAVSPDGKTYTITIRDAVFHDGVRLTADDVAYTFATIQDPAWKSPSAKNFSGIAAKAADAKTVVFTLKEPNSYFPSLLTVGIIPKHIWEKTDPAAVAASDFNLRPIGTGPYRFLNFTKNSDGDILSYSLRAADPSAKIDRITFKFFDDYETAVDKLSSNAVDGLNFIPLRLYSAVQKIPNVAVRKIGLSEYTAIFMNAGNQPIFNDPDVRRALALAIDRKKIISEALDGAAAIRNSPLMNDDAGATVYGYDPGGAAALLDKAGFAMAPGAEVRAKTETTKAATKKTKAETATTELDLELTVLDTVDAQRTAAIIKEGWEAVGAKVNIISVSSADIQKTAVKDGDYQALVFGEIIGADGDPFSFWHSSQADNGLNLSKYSNRRVDELLEKARAATDPAAKQALLAEFDKIVTTDAAAIFLYSPDYLYPQSTDVKNFSATTMVAPSDRFAGVTDWYIKKAVSFK